MANEGKFRRLQCEQACENKVGKAKCFAVEPLKYINNYGDEVGALNGGTAVEELQVILYDEDATIEQLKQAYEEGRFDAVTVSYDDGMEETEIYYTIGVIKNMSFSIEDKAVSIEIDSSYLTNVGTNNGIKMAGYITNVNFNNNEATVNADGLLGDSDTHAVYLSKNVGAYSPISIRVTFLKL